MKPSAPLTVKPGLNLDQEQSELLFADIVTLLDSNDFDIGRKCFAIWQRIQDWAGQAASGQPCVPLRERLEMIRREEQPDEAQKARLIRAIVFQALERNLDSDARVGSFSATLALIGDIARLGWNWGAVKFSELGERYLSVSALAAIELDEIGVSMEEELTDRLVRLMDDGNWLRIGALKGSAIPVLYLAMADLYVRAAGVQSDRKAATRDDLARGLEALDRAVGPCAERLVKLSGQGLASIMLDNLMQRPAIVASLTRLGRK